MSNVISIAVEKWSAEDYEAALKWLHGMYGGQCSGGVDSTDTWVEETWYVDYAPLCQDLVMRKDIYFMFCAAFGENYGTPRQHS